MDGTWSLAFDLAQDAESSTGSALLTLANGVEYLFTLRGRRAGQTVILNLAADPSDPAAHSIRIRTTMTPLEGDWARLDAFSATGYGQSLRW